MKKIKESAVKVAMMLPTAIALGQGIYERIAPKVSVLLALIP